MASKAEFTDEEWKALEKGVVAAGTATDATKKAIMLDALAGLAHVHGARLIHRDIKPDNIMLNSTGTAKLSGWM